MFEEQKYRTLIRQYKSRIYSYSLYMLGNKMDADDVTQEVMIKIWNNLDKFNILSAKTWIIKTTHNLSIDYLRKRSVAKNRDAEIDVRFEETYSENRNSDDPCLTTHHNMIASKVKEAVQLLPETMKSVFVLYEIQGMKYKEISKALNLPVNSVKVYLFRARKKLQEELKGYEQ